MRIYFAHLLVLSLALICMPTRAQEKPAQMPTKDIALENIHLSEALPRLAQQYRTVIGFETADVRDDRPITIKLTHATLRQALDALVQADYRFAWQQNSDGAIHVYNLGQRLSLPDKTLNQFTADHLNWGQVWKSLRSDPDMLDWMKQNQCHFADYVVVTGRVPVNDHLISIDASGQSLRDVLDEVVSQLGTYYWEVREGTSQSGCGVTVNFTPNIYIPGYHP